jgi:hypothetical protein
MNEISQGRSLTLDVYWAHGSNEAVSHILRQMINSLVDYGVDWCVPKEARCRFDLWQPNEPWFELDCTTAVLDLSDS